MLKDFWNDVDAEAVSEGKYEAPTFDDAPLPQGKYAVMIERAGWQCMSATEMTLSLMWRVMEGPHANRVVFQKLLLDGAGRFDREDKVAAKRKKARTMFAIITRLARADQLLMGENWPTDEELANELTDKMATIGVSIWKMKDEENGGVKTGNWVSGVEVYSPASTTPKTNNGAPKTVLTGMPASKEEVSKRGATDLYDEIPF
jgi:hypothetical protein